MSESKFLPALAAAELPEGKMRRCTVAGREIVVCHTRDGLFALDNICTHAYARMDEGRLRGVRLICPLHGASFDVRNGQPLGAPASVALATHALRVIDAQIEIAIDPAAMRQTTP